MGSRPCLHGGRLFAGMTRGWVPAYARTREGMGMGSRIRLHGGRLSAGMTRGWVPAYARTREEGTGMAGEGEGGSRTRPYGGVGRWNKGGARRERGLATTPGFLDSAALCSE